MKNLEQSKYSSALETVRNLKRKYGSTWNDINPENAARMVAQNRFKTGLDIARYTAAIMRKDMAEYDADPSKYTYTFLGGWWLHYVQNLDRYLISLCMKKLPCQV